jgi:hypothetical protein
LPRLTDQFLDGFYDLVEARAAEIAAGEFAATPGTSARGRLNYGFEMTNATGLDSRGVRCKRSDPYREGRSPVYVRGCITEKPWQL